MRPKPDLSEAEGILEKRTARDVVIWSMKLKQERHTRKEIFAVWRRSCRSPKVYLIDRCFGVEETEPVVVSDSDPEFHRLMLVRNRVISKWQGGVITWATSINVSLA